jgi:sRNA-binding carbon storage regulator CsrA
MLVLSRKRDEEVVLHRNGVEIGRVMVVDIRGDKVRLSFKGFSQVTEIDRAEIAVRKNGAIPHPSEGNEGKRAV